MTPLLVPLYSFCMPGSSEQFFDEENLRSATQMKGFLIGDRWQLPSADGSKPEGSVLEDSIPVVLGANLHAQWGLLPRS